jgi:hypothetical protein
MLLRIADVDPDIARKLSNVPLGTYNSWLKDEKFVALYRRRDSLAAEFKVEAVNLLRRNNQLEAVLLEEKIVAKMKEEIDKGEYKLVRTHLAREVYSKLISELDVAPKSPGESWGVRIGNLIDARRQTLQIEGGEPHGYLEADIIQETELEEGTIIPKDKQEVEQVEEETCQG